MKCQARQVSDQMNCHACGLVWDMNDLDPPKCRNGEHATVEKPAAPPKRVKPTQLLDRVRQSPAYLKARAEIESLLSEVRQ